MIKKLVVTDAFMKHEEMHLLNPALKPYEKELLGMAQVWANTKAETPLSWLATTLGAQPSVLLAPCVNDVPKASQYWVVSPYHARITRST